MPLQRNFLFVISGPSAVGKTTVASAILDHYKELRAQKQQQQKAQNEELQAKAGGGEFSEGLSHGISHDASSNVSKISRVVTCTTRSKRGGEVDGVDYIFLTKEEFFRRKDLGDFVEFSEVYGNYYGVLFSVIQDKIDSGENSLLVINWEGFQKIKKKFGEKVVGVFLTPPSARELENRIRNREQDSEETIQNRMKVAEEDMRHKDEFDHCIENDVLDKTVDKIIEILNGHLNS